MVVINTLSKNIISNDQLISMPPVPPCRIVTFFLSCREEIETQEEQC